MLGLFFRLESNEIDTFPLKKVLSIENFPQMRPMNSALVSRKNATSTLFYDALIAINVKFTSALTGSGCH